MKRITSTIDDDLKNQIKEMADKANWSFDYMVYQLLKQAVKERNRKKRVIEKNNS